MSARSCIVWLLPLLAGCPPAGGDVRPTAHVPAFLEGMDPAVAPGDDFFAFGNGGWARTVQIPADRASYGTDEELQELTEKRMAELFDELTHSGPSPGSMFAKVLAYRDAFLDEKGIEARGLEPLKPQLARIAAIANRGELSRALGETLRADVDLFNATHLHTAHLFGFWVAQDLDQPARYSPFLVQGGLGMPDRSYYLDESPRMSELRGRYQAHLARMLELAGIGDSAAKAGRVFALEVRIARTHATVADTERVELGNNHWVRKDFEHKAPGMEWEAFLGAAGLAKQDAFVVWQPGAVTRESALVRDEPLETWKDYLAVRAIEDAAPVLPKRFDDEGFAFHGSALGGTPQQQPRWRRAIDETSVALGEWVGKLYAARYFPAEEKARAAAMVANEIAAFRVRIDRLAWMSPQTKARAKAKLDTLKVGVGYPDRFLDYSALEVRADDAFGNRERAGLFELRRNLAKLGQPVDRGEWAMTPQMVDAVNLPAMNAINFPAAILQPPYFDARRPSAMDYGSAGSVIGHEISHSFDDQGAQFDENGRFENWWTPDDLAHFQASSAALARQFDTYRPFPDLAVNGTQTLSENLADLAGLAVALDAYHASLGGQPAPEVEGFTGDQLFFLSYAQGWRGKMRDPALRRLVMTNGHAPPMYRVATVRNLDDWYAAWNVHAGQALFLPAADRVRPW